MTTPDIAAWEHAETLHELVRVVCGLNDPGGKKAYLARLGRLTEVQRAEVAEAMERSAMKWAAD